MSSYREYLKKEIERCENNVKLLKDEERISICTSYINRLKNSLKKGIPRLQNSMSIDQDIYDSIVK